MKEDGTSFFICSFCGRHHSVLDDICSLSGQKIPPHHKLVGHVLENKYYIEGVLGEGGMGVVYSAKHTIIGRKLAVKILYPEIASNPRTVQRFYNEARTAASIGNEHIIEITDMGSYNDSPFLVMEFLEGNSLAAHLKGKILPVEPATGIIIQALEALSEVHFKGIIHRDLKPENIVLIERDGRDDYVKILDFGISKLKTPEAQEMRLTRTGTILGTPYYMAPEQAAGKDEQDHRVDLYSVGVILYRMLTGKLPHMGDNYNALISSILVNEVTPPIDHNPEIPEGLNSVIMKSLERNPYHRYGHATDFIEALKPYAPAWAIRPTKLVGLDSTMESVPPAKMAAAGGMATGSQTGGASRADWTVSREQLEQPVKRRSPLVFGAIGVIVVLALGALGLTLGLSFFKDKDKTDGRENASAAIELIDASGAGKTEREEEAPAADEGKGANVTFTGLPDGAVISIDDEALKQNPSLVAPSEKKRSIRIEARGYEPWTDEMVIKADTEISVTMKKAPAPQPVKGGMKKNTPIATGRPSTSDPTAAVLKKDQAPPPDPTAAVLKNEEAPPPKPPIIVIEKKPEDKQPEKPKEKKKKTGPGYTGKVDEISDEYPE